MSLASAIFHFLTFFALFYNSIQLRLPFGKTFFFPSVSNDIYIWLLFSDFFLLQNFLALKCLFLYLIQQQGGGRRAGGGFFFEIHVQNFFSEFFSQNFLALKCLFLYLIQQQGGRRAGGGLPGKLGDHWIRRSLLHWEREREIILRIKFLRGIIKSRERNLHQKFDFAADLKWNIWEFWRIVDCFWVFSVWWMSKGWSVEI